MFSWFKKIFTDESEGPSAGKAGPAKPQPHTAKFVASVDAPSSTATTGRGLVFHADLIPKLLSEHRVVLDIYGRVLKSVEAKDWAGVASLLVQFRKGLQDHLLDEAVRLYVYLQKSVDDDESKDLIRGFRSEMEGIGRVVIKTLDRFEDIAKSDYLQELFESEWKNLGAVLGDRIAREEKTLYPMYT